MCLTSHRQRGHLETATPFTVPCEGREARSDRELNPGPSHGSPLRYRCVTQAPHIYVHLQDLLGLFVRVGYRIPVPDFYLVLHGIRCRKSIIMDQIKTTQRNTLSM